MKNFMVDYRRALRKGFFLARDEYPIYIASIYELMVKYSAQNNNNGSINRYERRYPIDSTRRR